MPHTVNTDVLTNVFEFISEILPLDSSAVVRPKDPASMSIKELKASIRELGLAEKALGFSEKQEFIKLLEEFYSSKGF
jgi:hypothetical protein